MLSVQICGADASYIRPSWLCFVPAGSKAWEHPLAAGNDVLLAGLAGRAGRVPSCHVAAFPSRSVWSLWLRTVVLRKSVGNSLGLAYVEKWASIYLHVRPP